MAAESRGAVVVRHYASADHCREWHDEVISTIGAHHPWLTPNVIYHAVAQRSECWLQLRRFISASSLASAIGLNPHERTRLFLQKALGIVPPSDFTSEACQHGTRMEPHSEAFLIVLMKKQVIRSAFLFKCVWARKSIKPSAATVNMWAHQTYSRQPGYITPISAQHAHFTRLYDEEMFGVSMDMEGPLIDCEIKNPWRYWSFKKNYYDSVHAYYFVQVQWQMAMRERNETLYFVTSYDDTGVLLGYVLWHISFAKDFFYQFILPRARLMGLHIRDKVDDGTIEDMIPWLARDNAFQDSDEYQQLMADHCTMVYRGIDGPAVSRSIERAKEQKKTATPLS